ncbi:transporter substrate-binding domain-containing protein [Terasakiella sp. SH-1]|uniref:transporter substrate-binding domain-containing protein n=1 Tax=Terasakiella sp. SH-1 TaxID=2560057 RepID=UPI0010733F7B|nr:transporter substrate-binding domain-containing protein [Terasakiella sp. SH-1]
MMRKWLVALMLVYSSVAYADTYQVASTTVSRTVDAAFERIRHIYQVAGHDLEIVLESNARSIESANNGKYDCELARVAGVNAFYKNLIPLEDPYFYQELVIAHHHNETEIPRSLEELAELLKRGNPVGFPRGNKFLTNALSVYDGQAVTSGKSLMKMVSRGRLRYAASFLGVMEVHTEEFPDVRVRLDQPLLRIPMFHYVHKKNENLVKPLSLATRQVNADNGGPPSVIEMEKMLETLYKR